MKILNLAVLLLLLNFQFALAQFKQTPLPYAYNALEGSIDAKTMEIHYTKHAAGYVNNLNKAIAGTPQEKQSLNEILAHVSTLSPSIRNNAGGHYNHELFWTILTPQKNTQPSEKLLNAINETFGNLETLKEKISTAGANRFGSGWAWLIVTPDKKLAVTSTANQDNPLMDVIEEKGIPILGIDVWEHAYYLKYQNKRADYLNAIWDVINWNNVSNRYDAATKSRFDEWPEIKNFHGVMSGTFHPSEKGDLQPIKNRIDEMVTKSKALKTSKIPAEFNKKGMGTAINNLVKQSEGLQKKIKSASDAEITKSLKEIHDIYHTIIGLCNDEEEHAH